MNKWQVTNKPTKKKLQLDERKRKVKNYIYIQYIYIIAQRIIYILMKEHQLIKCSSTKSTKCF